MCGDSNRVLTPEYLKHRDVVTELCRTRACTWRGGSARCHGGDPKGQREARPRPAARARRVAELLLWASQIQIPNKG